MATSRPTWSQVQVLKAGLQYKYKYFSRKYKYLKSVLKYSSSTSTSTNYGKSSKTCWKLSGFDFCDKVPSITNCVRVTMTTDVAVTSVAQVEDTTYTNDRPRGTTSELDVTPPSSWAGQQVINGFLIGISVVAFIANVAMLISLLAYRQTARKTVNIFVCNQTVLDLVASFFAAVTIALGMSGYTRKTKTGVLTMFLMKIVTKHRWP